MTVKIKKTSYSTQYYFNDKLHREDGPAIDEHEGYKEWCINGLTHRLDGPAIEYSNGSHYWFVNGVDLTVEITGWFQDTGFNPDYTIWTDQEKLQFKLVWG